MRRTPVVAILFTLLVACAVTVPIQPREPISVPSGLSPTDVELAILMAIEDRPLPPELTPGQEITDSALRAALPGYARVAEDKQRQYDNPWYFVDRNPGSVHAAFQRNHLYMRVRFDFNTERVRTEIVDSRHFRQTDTHIHKNAYVHIRKFERRLRRALGDVSRQVHYGPEKSGDTPSE